MVRSPISGNRPVQIWAHPPLKGPSILDESHPHSGILTGLQRVRFKPQYQTDSIKEEKGVGGRRDAWEHAFFKPGDRTPAPWDLKLSKTSSPTPLLCCIFTRSSCF